MKNFKGENDYDEQSLNAYWQQEIEEGERKEKEEAKNKSSWIPFSGFFKAPKSEVSSDPD